MELPTAIGVQLDVQPLLGVLAQQVPVGREQGAEAGPRQLTALLDWDTTPARGGVGAASEHPLPRHRSLQGGMGLHQPLDGPGDRLMSC